MTWHGMVHQTDSETEDNVCIVNRNPWAERRGASLCPAYMERASLVDRGEKDCPYRKRSGGHTMRIVHRENIDNKRKASSCTCES